LAIHLINRSGAYTKKSIILKKLQKNSQTKNSNQTGIFSKKRPTTWSNYLYNWDHN